MGRFFEEKEHEKGFIGDLNDYLRIAEIKRSLIIGCILLFAAVAVFVAFYITIPITRNASGIVFPVEGAISIYNDKAMHKVYAHAGQKLQKGDTILQYVDGSVEMMPEDGLLIGVNRNVESAGSGGKVASYIANGVNKQIFVFLPLEQSMNILKGQDVNIFPKSQNEASTVNYRGTVSYISDSFFYSEEVVDFVGSTDMTIALEGDLSMTGQTYRLIGISSEEYIGMFAAEDKTTYDSYINSICNVTITLRSVSIWDYLFSGRW